MKIFWLLFLMGIFLESTKGEETDTKLLLVQILFRHGDRAPVALYPNDPNPENIWPEGLGKLTSLGKKQAFALGELFRQMYGHFITSNPNEITVNSSQSDRCVRSALANVAAFYKPSAEWKLDNTIDWQPIPVHSVEIKKDKYLAPHTPCPRSSAESKKHQQEQNDLLRVKHKEMIENLTLLSGLNMSRIINLFILQDTLMIEKQHDLIIPSWANYYWNELQSASEAAFQSFTQPKIVQKLRIGPLLGSITEDMTKKSEGGIPDIKVRVYSSHDFEVAVMLHALKVPNMKRPPYAATIVFELREKTDGEKVVRLLYLNSTTPEDVFQVPHPLILDGCSEYCPLGYFMNFTKDMIPENWEQECGLEDSKMKGSCPSGRK